MQVTLNIPDNLAAQFAAEGKDPSRAALEALAVEGYRTEHLTESEVRQMLGYETRMQVHALLQEHDVPSTTPRSNSSRTSPPQTAFTPSEP